MLDIASAASFQNMMKTRLTKRVSGKSSAPTNLLTNPAPELENAVRLHQAGETNQAEIAYRRVLSRNPTHPDALNLLGTLVAGNGHLAEGTELVRQALASKPIFPEALINLASIRLQASDPAAADACCTTALSQSPANPQAFHNRAIARQTLGRLNDALTDARSATDHRPGDASSWHLAGSLLDTLDRPAEAETAFRRACALAPRAANHRTSLGNLLFKMGRRNEAEATLRLAVHNAPASVNALYNLGAVLRACGNPAEAEAMLQRALAIDPRHADAWNALGACLRSLGRFNAATDCFRKALTLRPGLASAWRHLTLSGRNVAGEADRSALEMLSHRDLPNEEAASVRFALAKLLDEQDRPDEAFAQYQAANALVAATFAGTPNAYDPKRFEQMLDGLRTNKPWENTGTAQRTELPVLVVGMPRSATSLVEQILASHPSVFGAGELPDLRRLIRSVGPAEAGAAYASRLKNLSQGTARVIDKMPDNIFELGHLAAMLPDARVILCRRDPRDIGVSCFTTHFSAGNAFSYALADCGHRIRHTEALADHWRQTLPLPLLTVDYEALVDDLEGQSRRMIEFLDLPWRSTCLDFHRTDRPVTTASAWQVRQPLFRNSVGRWRRYAPHLTELLNAL